MAWEYRLFVRIFLVRILLLRISWLANQSGIPRNSREKHLMPEVKIGLQDVVIATSEICAIDGEKGTLVYRGYDIHDLAEHSTFEEVVYLLWHGRLPKEEELEEFEIELAGNRSVPPEI